MDYADYLESFLSCRGHVESAPDGGFSLPGDKPHYARDKVVDYKHFRLDISLDLDAKRVAGTVAHTFSAINEGVTSIDLDQRDLEITDVRIVDGEALKFSVEDGRLKVDFPQALEPGKDVTISVEFAGSPRRGLYFIGPDEAYPDKRIEAWTQGEDEDSRHWFPCYDYPNEMATERDARHRPRALSRSSPTVS